MSQTQYYADDSRNLNLSEEQFKHMELRGDVAWYNPTEDAIYVSNDDKIPRFEPGMKAIPNVTKAHEQKMLKRQGKLDFDSVYNVYNKQDGWQDKLADYIDWKKRHAGIMAPANFSGIEVTNVLANVLFGVNEKQYILQNAVQVRQTPYITMALDTWTGFDVKTDIPIGAEIPTDQGSYSRQTVTLKMDGSHISRYDELDLKPFYHDIWRDNLENIGRRMVKAKAQKVATELETATGIAAGDWAAYTTDHSTRNPLTDLLTASAVITGNDGVPAKVAMDPLIYAEYLTNTHINSPTAASPDAVNQTFTATAFQSTLPKAGFSVFVDSLLTDTIAIIWDDQAVLLAQGPTGTAQYRDEHHRSTGYYAKDYNTVKIIQSGKIRKLTGI
jgi:hypothetical protein